MSMARPEKMDFKKTHKELYTATRKVKEVKPGKGCFLSVSGRGEPGGAAFQKAIEKLYTLAYTLKFSLLLSEVLDFCVAPMECVWEVDSPDKTPRTKWPWTLSVRIPEQVTAKQLNAARKAVMDKRGLDTADVKRVIGKEGPSLQVLHVGAYDDLPRTYDALQSYAGQHELRLSGYCRELYLNNPHRTDVAKLRTIVRVPVSKAR
jgi:hypothetical protein